MINVKIRHFGLALSSWIFLISLALTPIHTKISGVAWVSFVLFSLFFITVYRNRELQQSNQILVCALKYLILFSLISLVIRWIPQIALGEFNQASNFNIRVLVITVLSYLICKKLDERNHTIYLFRFLPYSLLFLGISALAITLPFGENTKFGTHPIPWAAAVSILTVVLHIHMLNQIGRNNPNKTFIILSWLTSIAVLLAILVTGKRGSYFYLIWLLCFGLYTLYFVSAAKLSIKNILLCVIAIVTLCIGSYFVVSEFYQAIWQRVVLGYQEVVLYFDDPILAANTSVGARLYMWHHALLSLDGNWLFGLGIDGTAAMIKSFAVESGAPMLVGLNQLHNEYLQALVSYGVFGLISFLLYPIGLLFIAFKLRKQHPQAFVGLLGIVLLFLTSSLTNTNTYHNYFGTVFSLSVGLVFVVCRLQESQQTKTRPCRLR